MSECVYNEKYFDVDGNRVIMKIIPEECILETDDKTILNEFIESLWWMDLNDRAIYFESWLSRTLKPHYQHIFFRELARAIEYINIENKAKEIQNG